MASLGTIRNGGIAGIIYTVVVVAVGFIVPPPPGADDPARKFLEYMADNRTALMIQASVMALAAIPLLPFAFAFAQRIRTQEGEHPVLGYAAAAGLLLGWAVAAPFILMYGGLAWLADGSLAESEAKTLTILATAGYGGVLALWAGAAVFSGLALMTAQGFSRWLGWFGLLAALLCAVGVFGWGDSGLLSPGPALLPGYLLFFIFLLANAIMMVRSKE